jgi:hypothetical protein
VSFPFGGLLSVIKMGDIWECGRCAGKAWLEDVGRGVYSSRRVEGTPDIRVQSSHYLRTTGHQRSGYLVGDIALLVLLKSLLVFTTVFYSSRFTAPERPTVSRNISATASLVPWPSTLHSCSRTNEPSSIDILLDLHWTYIGRHG